MDTRAHRRNPGDRPQPGGAQGSAPFGRALRIPATLDVAGQLDTDTKSRGLFEARVYQWQGLLSGRFALPEASPVSLREGDRMIWGQPWLAIALDDPRGIIGQPTLEWGGTARAFERGSRLKLQSRGVHALLPAWSPGQGGTVDFSVELALRGTERIAFVPLGDTNRFELASSWPHPSFGGRYLPDPESQQLGEEGFRAVWTVSALAADAAQQLRSGEAACGNGCGYALDTMEVRLVEPVAIYTLSDRALKYGHLFIVLTFAAFFIFEALKRLAIHPIQYLFVGLALAVFFLLLISLSEHLDFAIAYALAALSCCGLITVYLATVLGSRRRGLAFGGALAGLFAALYFLLRSEDNALMLGSLLIFGLLAAAMIATRKVRLVRARHTEDEQSDLTTGRTLQRAADRPTVSRSTRFRPSRSSANYRPAPAQTSVRFLHKSSVC